MTLSIHCRQVAGSLLITSGLAFLGCGGSSSSSPAMNTGPTGSTSTPLRVAFGDAPADWITAFGMTLDSVTLTTSTGSTVSVTPASANLEMTQLMGSVQPVSTVSVPQGSYTQATVSFSKVTMGYMDPIARTYKQTTLAGPFTATVPFAQGLTAGSAAMALNFDMDMASSVAIDGSGTVTLTPVLTASTATVPASGQTPQTGGMQHQVGTVSGVTATGFTLGSMMGMASSTFATDAGTQFTGTGLSAMSGMANGMMVAVDASLKADGSYLATRVQAMGATTSGTMGGGLVTALSGTPPTQMTVAVGSGMGAGMMPSSIAGTVSVSLSSSTAFAYDADGMDLSGLPFTPAFGLSNLALGQRVEAVSPSGMAGGGMMGGGMMGALSGGPVTLEPQGLHGAVSGYTAAGSQAVFTLTLPTDSAFASLTGLTSVQVYQQAGTSLQGMTSVADSAYVNVRGLLFFDGTAYRFVAGMIEPGATFTQSPGSTPAPPAGSTAMTIALGDAPSDRIMAFGMTVNSIVLTSSTGSTVNVAPTAAALEMTQLMAGVQPVSAFNVPQGTYTQATVTMSSISMGYLDPVTKAYTQKTLAGPTTATVPFTPSLTVGTTPMALNFDMDMAASVSIDGSGNVTLAPVMTASTAALGATPSDPWAGVMQHQVGSVSNAAGSTFTMGSMMGIGTTTFSVDANTQYSGAGLTGMAGLGSGMLVDVDAVMQADGTYLARRVEAMGPGTSGMVGGGIVTAITGNPPTQFTLAMNGGMGGGMMASLIAGTTTVTLGSTTPWAVDSDLVDLANLPFTPAFGPATFTAGQRVEVTSNGGMTMGGGMMGGSGTRTLAAAQVRLEPQGLHGTVSAYAASGSQATFTLTLPSDAAFTTLTGASTVQVYQQAGTLLHGMTSVTNGQVLEVRGLLFFDGTTYRLVAGWMNMN